MLNETIKKQIKNKDLLDKINTIRSVLGYGKYLFSEEELVNCIQEADYSVNYHGYACICFGNCQINMSLEDFELLKEEIKGL